MSRPGARRLFGIRIEDRTMPEALAEVEALIRAGGPSLVVTPNVQHVCLLHRDADFRSAYAAADLILPDSVPLIWASRLLGAPLRERVAGSDILPAFCGSAAARGFAPFFLGAGPGVAAAAARLLGARHPGLRVAGVLSPPPGFDRDERANRDVLDRIRAARPDVLFVGLGSPKGEVWAWRHGLSAGVPVTICIGAGFDFLAGIQKRAPLWMRNLGFEWLFRLVKEPRRLWKRYIFGNALFVFLCLKEALAGRPRAGGPGAADAGARGGGVQATGGTVERAAR